jgi:hypothetical protein
VGDLASRVDELLLATDDAELAQVWARCWRAMRERGVLRSKNVVGDPAENECRARFRLELQPRSARGIDAVDQNGVRYQIKARWLTPENRSHELGAIRDIEKKPFDILLAVFFEGLLELDGIWSVPREVVADARFVARTNSTKFVLTPAVKRDPRVRKVA